MVIDGAPYKLRLKLKQHFIKVDLDNKQKRLYEKYLNRP